MKGIFVDFYLPFVVDGNMITPRKQAEQILIEAEGWITVKNRVGVAITYSANHLQSARAINTYDEGIHIMGIGGANQAAVMGELEKLLQTHMWEHLLGRVRIACITTMYYIDPGRVPLKEAERDLKRIENLLESGWVVLGWKNQVSGDEYAIGGGVSGKLPANLQRMIQQTLHRYKGKYKQIDDRMPQRTH